MTLTFLVVGSTGNTDRAVEETLSTLMQSHRSFAQPKILALTRDAKGEAAQHFTSLPNVQVIELNWVDITADWLRENNVVRAFIASHNQPNQFAVESAFYVAALRAQVEYVVRVLTTAANVRPDCPAYYPRTPWAIESLLSAPEFGALKWTSLQPNIYSQFVLAHATELVKHYRETGRQDILRLMSSKDASIGIIDSNDVGVFAAHLLVKEALTPHHKAKYVLNGPEDITGRQITEMVEQYIGTQIKDVSYMDMPFIDQMAASSPESKSVILTVKHTLEMAWEGQCTASPTSKEVLEIAAPNRTRGDVFKTLLGEHR